METKILLLIVMCCINRLLFHWINPVNFTTIPLYSREFKIAHDISVLYDSSWNYSTGVNMLDYYETLINL